MILAYLLLGLLGHSLVYGQLSGSDLGASDHGHPHGDPGMAGLNGLGADTASAADPAGSLGDTQTGGLMQSSGTDGGMSGMNTLVVPDSLGISAGGARAGAPPGAPAAPGPDTPAAMPGFVNGQTNLPGGATVGRTHGGLNNVGSSSGMLPTRGMTPPGGMFRTGGMMPSGGMLPTGGMVPPGGMLPAGGMLPSGGMLPTGGMIPSGGMLPTGGMIPSGGMLPTGGMIPPGGMLPTGGRIPSGSAGRIPPSVLPGTSVGTSPGARGGMIRNGLAGTGMVSGHGEMGLRGSARPTIPSAGGMPTGTGPAYMTSGMGRFIDGAGRIISRPATRPRTVIGGTDLSDRRGLLAPVGTFPGTLLMPGLSPFGAGTFTTSGVPASTTDPRGLGPVLTPGFPGGTPGLSAPGLLGTGVPSGLGGGRMLDSVGGIYPLAGGRSGIVDESSFRSRISTGAGGFGGGAIESGMGPMPGVPTGMVTDAAAGLPEGVEMSGSSLGTGTDTGTVGGTTGVTTAFSGVSPGLDRRGSGLIADRRVSGLSGAHRRLPGTIISYDPRYLYSTPMSTPLYLTGPSTMYPYSGMMPFPFYRSGFPMYTGFPGSFGSPMYTPFPYRPFF